MSFEPVDTRQTGAVIASVPASRRKEEQKERRLLDKPTRIEILGVPVDCVDMPGALQYAESLFDERRAHTVLAVNPEKVMRARDDPQLLRELQSADLLIPDGIGVVVAARVLGLGRMGRVAGSELMPELCARAAATGHGVYLFGAQESVNEIAAKELVRRFPGLTIAGRHHGYVEERDIPGLIADINRSGAAILFVALGSPRQELWMGQHREQFHLGVCQGVGGTFDVIAGHVRRAPRLFIRLNLEWLYRLLSNPGRLLRQTALPRFAGQVVWAALRARLHWRRK